jgi:hypothetical protein
MQKNYRILPHSMTSPARSRIDFGTVSPISCQQNPSYSFSVVSRKKADQFSSRSAHQDNSSATMRAIENREPNM